MPDKSTQIKELLKNPLHLFGLGLACPYMRVGFFGQSGPYAPIVLRHLLELENPNFEFVYVVEGQRRVRGIRKHRWYKGKARAMHTGDDLCPLATSGGVDSMISEDVNAPEAIKELQEREIDLLLCVGFDRLFKPEILNLPTKLAINCHPSALPRFRGPTPIFWILKAGQTEMAVTVHGMDEKEDHGPIYMQQSFAIPSRATGDTIYRLAASHAAGLCEKVLKQAAVGSLEGTAQNDAEATRAPRPKPEDSLIDPSDWQCEALVNFCCAAPYFRIPWFKMGEEPYFIMCAIKAIPGDTLPGDSLVQGKSLFVQCQDGVCELEIQT